MTVVFSLVAIASVYLLYRYVSKWIESLKAMAAPPPPEAPEGVTVLRDIEFTRTAQGSLLLDVYLPTTRSNTPLPVLMFIYGGGWAMGNKHQVTMLNGQRFSQHGYAVVSISYRLSDVATFPAQIHDCKAALRWVRQEAKTYGFNPLKIGVFGGSAGGHLSALLGTSAGVADLEGDLPTNQQQFTGPVQAVVDFFGLTDLSQADSQRRLISHKYDSKFSFATNFLGGLVSQMVDQVKRANPINYIKPSMPPFLIIHGKQDRVVPVGQSEILHRSLLAQGNLSDLHIIEGAGHTTTKHYRTDELFQRIKTFFDTHLK